MESTFSAAERLSAAALRSAVRCARERAWAVRHSTAAVRALAGPPVASAPAQVAARTGAAVTRKPSRRVAASARPAAGRAAADIDQPETEKRRRMFGGPAREPLTGSLDRLSERQQATFPGMGEPPPPGGEA